jgi:arginine utilization regulatory protein
LRIVEQSAESPSPILITGETGTGKEMIARLIHEKSSRVNKPFLALNCAAIPATLIESLLMGTTKGSFTGAIDRPGIFEDANGGTVYLDEIDSMPLELQPKLLRILQEMTLSRLGSNQQRQLNFKLVSSIAHPPVNVIEKQLLRPDLFYRLAVIVVSLPPLRDRLDDLDDLINYFIYKYNTILSRKVVNIDHELLAEMRQYYWPGNVRELEYIIAGAMNMISDDAQSLSIKDLSDSNTVFIAQINQYPVASGPQMHPPSQREEATLGNSSPSMERSRLGQGEFDKIVRALTESQGNVAKAARSLNMSRQLLHYKVLKYHLYRSDFKRT